MDVSLSKLTRPEVEEYLKENDMVLFPVGSLEQHGKHLALDNDALSALEIAKRVAEKTGVLVAPVMPFGYSQHHMNFAGTITLESQTLVDVYKQVCNSLIHHGFNNIVIMNGHGGNRNWISQAIREILEETGVRVYSLMIFNSRTGFGSEALDIITQESGGHACEMETSFSMYLGQRALMEQAEDWKQPESWTEFTRKYKDKVTTARDFHEYTEIGSLGRPTRATKEKGEKLVKAVVEDIAEFINDLKEMKGKPAFYSSK